MTTLLHPSLTTLFEDFNQPPLANNQNAYYRPYSTLLYKLFDVVRPFFVDSRFDKNPRDATDVHATFTVRFKGHPVLFIQLNEPSSFLLDSKRKQADERMRDRFLDLRPKLATPRLLGISAFGTRLAFYEYTAATNTLTPHAIAADVAPAHRWNYDILEADGVARMRQVVHDVKAMCGVGSVQGSGQSRLILLGIYVFPLSLLLYVLATGLIPLRADHT